MKSSLLNLFCASSIIVGKTAVVNGYVCPMPTKGCTNGMFNVEKCECECIPPYCLYEYDGTCTLPSGDCENPWVDCERGLNCPWWISPSKGETCTTGPKIPPNVWNLYNTQAACCSVNFIHSGMCLPRVTGTEMPSKHPTITATIEVFELIPLKFVFQDMQDNYVSIGDLKAEMITVLKRILTRFSESVPGLRISNIEETLILARNLLKGTEEGDWRLRELEQDVDWRFHVEVFRDADGKKFSPLVVQAVKDNCSEITEQLQTYVVVKGYGGDLILNCCTAEDTCRKQTPEPTPAPTRQTRQPTPTIIDSEPESLKRFEGWKIALMITSCLILLCCVGYYFVASLNRGNHTTKTYNNFYSDEGADPGLTSGSMSVKSHRSRRSRRTNKHDETKIILKEPQIILFDDKSFVRGNKKQRRGDHSKQPRLTSTYDETKIVLAEPRITPFDNDVFTYGRKKQRRGDKSCQTYGDNEGQITVTEPHLPYDDKGTAFGLHGHRKKGGDRGLNVISKPPILFGGDVYESHKYRRRQPFTTSSRRLKRQGRDPSVFIPGQDDKPDPETADDVRSHRYSEEDPPVKPKRDPSIYGGDSVHRNSSASSPSFKPQREPSEYFEDQREPTMYDNRSRFAVNASNGLDPHAGSGYL